jgi:hypothetical protein
MNSPIGDDGDRLAFENIDGLCEIGTRMRGRVFVALDVVEYDLHVFGGTVRRDLGGSDQIWGFRGHLGFLSLEKAITDPSTPGTRRPHRVP